MKAIRNVILLLILSITASGIPLYADSFNFDSFISQSASTLAIEAIVTGNATAKLGVEVVLSTSNNHIPIKFNDTPLVLELYSGKKLIKSINYSEVAKISPTLETFITPNTPVKFFLELDQEKLDLSNGSYNLKIKTISNIMTLEAISTAVYFDTDFTYRTALQNVDKKETALTLYFPDNDYNHLIPIARIIPYTTTPLRKTVDELLKGPTKALGIPTGTFIPTPQLSLVGRTANVFLPADIGVFQTQSNTSYVAYNCFVESLTAIPEIDYVQFYFNWKKVEAGFHDLSVKDPISAMKGAKVYFGSTTTNNRILLTPYHVGFVKPSTDALFNMLKISGNVDIYSYNHRATVPEEVQLIKHQLEGTTLTLVLNEAFATIYQDKSNHRDLMLESLLHTFTSLDGVEAVQFEIDGTGDYKKLGIPLGTPIKPSIYINPEK